MKYLLVLLFLTGCDFEHNSEVRAAECFCKDHGGIRTLYMALGVECKDGTWLRDNDFLIEKDLCH